MKFPFNGIWKLFHNQQEWYITRRKSLIFQKRFYCRHSSCNSANIFHSAKSVFFCYCSNFKRCYVTMKRLGKIGDILREKSMFFSNRILVFSFRPQIDVKTKTTSASYSKSGSWWKGYERWKIYRKICLW